MTNHERKKILAKTKRLRIRKQQRERLGDVIKYKGARYRRVTEKRLRVASASMLDYVLDQSKVASSMEQQDEQTADLMSQVYIHLSDKLLLPAAENSALSRLRGVVDRGTTGAEARNQIFKAANELGIKLPSGMF